MFGKTLKGFTGAAFLAVLALPVVAQQSAESSAAQQQTAKKTIPLTPKYLVAYGRVLARTDQHGVTKFNYQNGRLVSEVQPNGAVGTYQYDSGKFTGIAYTDGRYITLTRNSDGTPTGLASNTGARVKFIAEPKPTSRAAFMAIQDGIAALRNPTTSNTCVHSDDDNGCVVVVRGKPDEGADRGGGGAYDDWGRDVVPYFGEGGGGGGISNPPGETPAECRANVCKPATATLLKYCLIATAGPGTLKACIDKAGEYNQ
jgi:hypothetical protein